MAMKLEEILESGLLELYVLGQLSVAEIQEVEAAILAYPEVKREVLEIEQALFKYDRLFKTPAPAYVLDNVLEQTKNSSTTDLGNQESGFNWTRLLGTLLGLTLLLGAFFYNKKTGELEQTIRNQEILIQECDEDKVQFAELQRINAAIMDYESKKIFISPTENYEDIELIIHNNAKAQKNYLQISNLPPLASNQSFQLWSLKGDSPPIPLDVFEDDVNQLLEIQFVEDTNAYAITIEPRGGQESPTLANLLGVFNVEG